MGFFDFFRSKARRSRPKLPALTTALANPGSRYALFGASWQPAARDAEALSEAYHRSPYYHAVIDKIADNAAATPLRLYAKYSASEGNRKYERDAVLKSMNHRAKHLALKELRVEQRLASVDGDHPLYRLLRQPLPQDRQFRGKTLLKLVFAWLETAGEAFVIFSLGKDGLPNALYPIPPSWVRDLPKEGADRFLMRFGGKDFEVPRDQVLWFKQPNLSDPYGRGLGTGHALADELDVDESAARHLAAYFKNRAMPEMLVSIKDADEEALKAAQVKFEQNHRGEDNAYRSAFVNGAIDVKRLDTAFKDMDLVNLRKFSGRDAIVQAHGVSPEMLGILDNSNRATSFEARYMFAENVLEPRLGLVEDVLQDFAARWDDRLIVAFDSPRPEDHEFLLKWSVAHPGASTLNEKRAIAQLPPVEGGDSLPEPGAEPKTGILPAAEDSPRDPNP